MNIAGIDEVGRGAWAGPLCVAVVVLDDDTSYPYADSKTLTASKREMLCKDIVSQAIFVHIEMIRPQVVDQLGLAGAMKQAMHSCVEAALPFAQRVIIDGTVDYAKDHNVDSEAIVKADNHVAAVSAASIVAKVHRDAYMQILSRQYPTYSLATNVGYGTSKHSDALRRAGAEWFHRHSYKPIQLLSQKRADQKPQVQPNPS